MSALAQPEAPTCRSDAGYELFGSPENPVVAVLGGISASRHVASNRSNPVIGWWEDCVGEGRAIDVASFRILGIDYATGVDTRDTMTTADQARHLADVLDQAGIQRLHAIVGASYGGMIALAFAEAYPERVDRLIVISASHESNSFAEQDE